MTDSDDDACVLKSPVERLETTSTMTQGASNSTDMAGVGGRQDDPSVDAWLRPVLYAIRLSFLPIIVAGTVTNCLNFVVLSHREMRSVSTSVYLFALAVADLGVMYFELFRIWFEWAQVVNISFSKFTSLYFIIQPLRFCGVLCISRSVS